MGSNPTPRTKAIKANPAGRVLMTLIKPKLVGGIVESAAWLIVAAIAVQAGVYPYMIWVVVAAVLASFGEWLRRKGTRNQGRKTN